MKYESDRSKENHYFSLSVKPEKNFSFPLHFHKSFELLFVEEGEQIVQIDGIEFVVCGGECALILPGQFHAYRSEKDSYIRVCIFSIDFLPDFDKYCKTESLHHPVLPISDPQSFQKLQKVQGDVFAIKSILYDFAARYVNGPPFYGFQSNRGHLLYDIVQYISEHFTESVTLKEMAEHFGYNYRYMSGIINRCFHLSFSQVLCQYRIDHACRLLKEGEDSITNISARCGFDNTRSFNRSFKAVMGLTPKEYRIAPARVTR